MLVMGFTLKHTQDIGQAHSGEAGHRLAGSDVFPDASV